MFVSAQEHYGLGEAMSSLVQPPCGTGGGLECGAPGGLPPSILLQSCENIPAWNRPVPGSASLDTSLHPAP